MDERVHLERNCHVNIKDLSLKGQVITYIEMSLTEIVIKVEHCY